jgi:hypothetical protein
MAADRRLRLNDEERYYLEMILQRMQAFGHLPADALLWTPDRVGRTIAQLADEIEWLDSFLSDRRRVSSLSRLPKRHR